MVFSPPLSLPLRLCRFSVAVLPSIPIAVLHTPGASLLLFSARGTSECRVGKACGKQAAQYTGKQPDEGSVVTSRDTTVLLAELQGLHHTHRETACLFLMTASQGAKDAQIACRKDFLISRSATRAPSGRAPSSH
jgi:hypothetical protein